MHSITTTSPVARTAGFAVLAWLVVLAARIAMDGANATWGWTQPAQGAYVLLTLALPVAGALLVVTQVRTARTVEGLGWVGGAGIGITALGAAAGFVAWADPVWASLLAVGMLLFGIAMLGDGRVPRAPALALTPAFFPTAAASLAGFPDTWMSVPLGLSVLVLALGLRSLAGRTSTVAAVQP